MDSSISSARLAGTDIVINNARKTFRRGHTETQALAGVDLRIDAGEFVAIVGPSGCGKSTLLQLISGLLEPTGGEIVIGGKTVHKPHTELGIVFQKPILLEWRNVLNNVLLQMELRKRSDPDRVARAKSLLASVGLTEFEDRYPHELSGGMQQRVAIVRALIHDPPLLLMDEPFGALDALTREQMRIDLEELWLSGGQTVVFITHSIDEAVLLSDRVVVMSPRPGVVERVIDIELPRPRGLGARKLPAFGDAVDTITEIFLARGVLHSGRSIAAQDKNL